MLMNFHLAATLAIIALHRAHGIGQHLAPGGELLAGETAQRVKQAACFQRAFDFAQEDEAFAVAARLWGFVRGQAALEFAGTRPAVNHDVFRRAGVDAASVKGDGRLVGVEVFVLQFAQHAAVQGVGDVRAKGGNVKMMRAAADFFIWRKSDADFAVRDFRVRLQVFNHRQDNGNAGFVIRAE